MQTGHRLKLAVSLGALCTLLLVTSVWLRKPPNGGAEPGELLNNPRIARETRINIGSSSETIPLDTNIWNSEQITIGIDSALKKMSDAIALGEFAEVQKIASRTLRVSHPERRSINEVHAGEGIRLRRWDGRSGLVESDSLAKLFSELTPDEVGGADAGQRKLKVIRVEASRDTVATEVRYEYRAVGKKFAVQQTGSWKINWVQAEEKLRIDKLVCTAFEEVATEGVRLEDCTESVLGAHSSYRDQILPGIPHWLSRAPKVFFGQFGHHGMAIADVNGDLLDDLYICDAGGLPNRLYVQRRDGKTDDVSPSSGVNYLDNSVAAVFVDLDNDGDQDLVVGTDAYLRISKNDGQGHFALVESIEIETDAFSISSADFDGDGLLDLFVCGYDVRKNSGTDQGLPFPIPYHDAKNGGRNILFRNDGSFQFRDVTNETGLGENNSRFSMAACWDDFDNDGDVDLYIANDFGRNNLYRNDGGHFIDIATTANVEDHASGMSVSCADFNRDGNTDIYVGNMFSSAGNRVTYQRNFGGSLASRDTATLENLRRMARGNTLFANKGEGKFVDATLSNNVQMGRWAWGSVFADVTNSGWPDLIIGNGYITNEDDADL